MHPADSSILFINQGKQVNETAIQYDVQLIDYHWRLANMEDAMGIIVSSALTKQKQKVSENVNENFG